MHWALRTVLWDIEPLFEVFLQQLAPVFEGFRPDSTEENLQARIRGTLLMAVSNKTGAMVLTTGNKSEMAVGYATLYGDMAGGFAAIKDVPKTLVYRLARYRNSKSKNYPGKSTRSGALSGTCSGPKRSGHVAAVCRA